MNEHTISAKVETALLDLKYALQEIGVELQFIKINHQIPLGGNILSSLHGIGIKTVVHEDDAEVWG